MAGFGALNSFAQQVFLYNAAGAIIGAALAPFGEAVRAAAFEVNPTVPLSPSQAAEAVLRNVMPADQAAGEARRGGLSGDRFAVLAQLAGNAPDPTSLAVALRRGLIDQGTYLRGIRQGRLRDEWADLVRELAVQQPSPTAILDAYLEGQVDEGTARGLWAKLGGDPDYFDILYNTQGQAPSPVQAADMANRGIIPWDGEGPDSISFRQAFLEGPWRNKWLAPMRKAAAYLPPPRTITAMYNEGTLSKSEAVDLLVQQGLTPKLAAAYVASGSSQKTQASRDLSVSTITTLYRDQLVSNGTALAMLESLGYDASEAGFVLAVEDLRRAQRYVETAVGRVHTLYTGHKVDRATAQAALTRLDVPVGNIDGLLTTWDVERDANIQQLTAAQVASAWQLGLMSQPQAQAELIDKGYQPHDAWLYLSVHNKGPLPNEPSVNVTPSPGP